MHVWWKVSGLIPKIEKKKKMDKLIKDFQKEIWINQ